MSENKPDHAKHVQKHNAHVKRVYEEHLQGKESNSPEASHWVDRDRVDLRFDVLTDIADLSGCSVLDFGCGNGLFRDYLKQCGVDCEYTGWDISEDMVEIARQRHPDSEFREIDILETDLEAREEFDWILVSGVFHISGDRPNDEHERWYKTILQRLWPLCEQGLAVNFFSEFVDWRDEELYYCSLDELVPFLVEELSRWYQIRHDYDLYELTAYVYREPEVAK
jgi:SAM-dependent methyltransferase